MTQPEKTDAPATVEPAKAPAPTATDRNWLQMLSTIPKPKPKPKARKPRCAYRKPAR